GEPSPPTPEEERREAEQIWKALEKYPIPFRRRLIELSPAREAAPWPSRCMTRAGRLARGMPRKRWSWRSWPSPSRLDVPGPRQRGRVRRREAPGQRTKVPGPCDEAPGPRRRERVRRDEAPGPRQRGCVRCGDVPG